LSQKLAGVSSNRYAEGSTTEALMAAKKRTAA
jgi:hypothetical protein